MFHTIFAQAEAAPSGAGQWIQWVFYGGIFLVFYLFFIRPQSVKQKKQRKFLEELSKGDKVVTIGGIHGTIVSFNETTVVLDVDGKGNKMTFERSALSMENSVKTSDKK
ncbi:MAG: preprotein translocase subunit YajC [Cytophagales bacterium]|nr:preprotein translocase subunit YajC [Cytophagales bacterium]